MTPTICSPESTTCWTKRRRRRNRKIKAGAEVVFQGKTVTVNSDKEQILVFLIATFEDIVRTNQELQTSRSDLAAAKRKVDEYARILEGRVRTTEDRAIERSRRWRKANGGTAAWSNIRRMRFLSTGGIELPL